MKILEGKGTVQQNSAVIANAGMAIYCGHQQEGLPSALTTAREALESGKALASFKKLLNH